MNEIAPAVAEPAAPAEKAPGKKWSTVVLSRVREHRSPPMDPKIGLPMFPPMDLNEALAAEGVTVRDEDRPELEMELERVNGGPFRVDLEELLVRGEHIPLIRRALDALHAGDENAKWLDMLSCLSAALSSPKDRTHSYMAGGPREGKSHLMERVGEGLFPSRFLRYDGASPKALYYEADEAPAFLRGKIAYFDEIADREDLWPLLKKIADSNSERLEHHSVTDKKKGKKYVLEALPVVQTAGAKDIADDQLNGRFLKSSIDETEEQDRRVVEHIAAEAAGKDASGNPDVTKAAALLEIIMENDPYTVLVPEATMIDFSAFGFTRARVDVSMLLRIVKATALLNRHRRPSWRLNGNTIVLASEADLAEAYRLWRAIGPTRETHLDSKAFMVLEKVPHGYPLDTPRIVEALQAEIERKQVSPATIHRKLDVLYEGGFVDRQQGERYGILLWQRMASDADLKMWKAGWEDGSVSQLPITGFSGALWKAEYRPPAWRKQALQDPSVSHFLTLLTGYDRTPEEIAEWIVTKSEPAEKQGNLSHSPEKLEKHEKVSLSHSM